jgi:CHRD domain-containing protein
MSKRLMLVVAVVLVVGSAIGVTFAGAQGGADDNANALTARLSPPSGSQDTNGVGAAAVTISGTRVCLAISFSGLSRVAAAHIHRGARGTNGPVVVDPKFTGASGTRGTLGRCVTPNAGTTAAQIRSNPRGFYVQIHTQRTPAGAVRGQLRRADS